MPELLPDYLREWEEDRDWLLSFQDAFSRHDLASVFDLLISFTGAEECAEFEGVSYKKAEMAITKRNLPEGFFGPARALPFLPLRPEYSLDHILRFGTTVKHLGANLNSTVLDIGVGYGWTTEWLLRLGYRPIGLDICRDYILAGLPRMKKNRPHLIVADVEAIPLVDEVVDAVLSFDAFHHVPNRNTAMREFARVMKPGAKIALVEPGKDHESHPQSVAVMEQHGILERGMDEDDLREYIQGTSLQDVRMYQTDAQPLDIHTIQKAGVLEIDSRTPGALLANISIEAKNQFTAGESLSAFLFHIRNAGNTIWLDKTENDHGSVRLTCNLFDGNRNLIKQDYSEVRLPFVVRPGDTIEFSCDLPGVGPGSYILEFDMKVVGFLAFKDYAYNAVDHLVFVEQHPAEGSKKTSCAMEMAVVEPYDYTLISKAMADKRKVEESIRDGNFAATVWKYYRQFGVRALLKRGYDYLRRA